MSTTTSQAQGPGPSPDPSSSSIKIIEVSAQEIVNRISQPLPQAPPPTTPTRSSSISEKQPEESNGTSGDPRKPELLRKVSALSIDESQQQRSPLSGRREQLLHDLQKWIQEAHTQQTPAILTQSLTNHLYYLHSIESFLKDLETPSLKVLSTKFSDQLLRWFKELFSFKNRTANTKDKDTEGTGDYNAIFPHWNENDGRINVTKLNLHLSSPELLDKGYDVFQEEGGKRPIIYASDEVVGKYILSSLGLSSKYLRVLDITKLDWTSSLDQTILADTKNNLVPALLLLNIGKTAKDLEKGCKVAESHNIWVHLYGRNTFSYLVKRQEQEHIAQSFTIDLRNWIPGPPMPFLTVLKLPSKTDQRRLELSGIRPTNSLEEILFVPWFCAKSHGIISTKFLVEDRFIRGQFLLNLIGTYDSLKIVPNWTVMSDGQRIISAITFRYGPKPVNQASNSSDSTGTPQKKVEFEQPSPQYIDTLNSWLYHIIERDLRSLLSVEFVYVEGSGWNILIDVFKCEKFPLDAETQIQETLDGHMKVLHSTVIKKMEFSILVQDCQELEWIDYESQWAGLGAVRYIPKFYRDNYHHDELAEKGTQQESVQEIKSNVNHLNAQIVEKLRSIDNAFSLGTDPSGDWCVQFGMVTIETDVVELVRLVILTGEEIEENSKLFNEMSEVVKKGIERAEQELKRESDEALWEEGILRHVPIVSTFVNWWSPQVKEAGIRGRALNIVEGKVESTENIYKYHMQVESPSSTSSGSTNSNNLLHKIKGTSTVSPGTTAGKK